LSAGGNVFAQILVADQSRSGRFPTAGEVFREDLFDRTGEDKFTLEMSAGHVTLAVPRSTPVL
jgi:hypothetical protein